VKARDRRRPFVCGEDYRMRETRKAASGGEVNGDEGKRRRGRRKVDKAALVEQVILSLEKRLKNEELKATVGDFIRLMQLEKELEEEAPKEIRVRWIEPEEASESEP